MDNTKQLNLFFNEPQPHGLIMYVVNGRNYRCVREPRSNLDFGRWEFEYKGKWHEVINFGIRKELNKQAGYHAR